MGAVLVISLLILEYGQLKWDLLETWITGKSKVLIKNGTIQEKSLAKVRMTVDQLEMTLREQHIANIQDVAWATLEPNGKIGFTLTTDAQAATKKDIATLQQSINKLISQQSQNTQVINQSQYTNSQVPKSNLFTEVEQHGHQQPPPEHLQ